MKGIKMKEIQFPVLNVKMVDIDKVIANDYNPNKVAPPEMRLLKHSIEEDGYTQPIVTYYDKNNNILLKEKASESKVLEEFQSYIVDESSPMSVESVETPDGIKNVVREAAKIPGKKLYHTRTYYEWQEDEAIYGLGQQEEGFLHPGGIFCAVIIA